MHRVRTTEKHKSAAPAAAVHHLIFQRLTTITLPILPVVDLDLVSALAFLADDKATTFMGYITLESAVSGIILEEVHLEEVFDLAEKKT